MTSFTSTLSSRGWAFMVLAGGFALAIPFFQGGSSAKPQYSSSKNTVASSKAETLLRTQPVRLGVDSSPLPSTKPILDKPASLSAGPPWRTTIEASGIVELKGRVGQATTGQTSPSPADNSAQIVQPTRQRKEQGLAGAAPIHTELPAWAKKPSLLDSLVTSNTTVNTTVDAGEHCLPEARKPSPYRAWTPQDNMSAVASIPTLPPDRYSPFRDPDEMPLAEQTPTRASTSWPDEDPRTAVAPKMVERLVGRDAMVRDPKILESLPERIGRTVVHPGESSNIPPSLNQSNLVVQPKFGQSKDGTDSGTRAQVGALLRSKLPPDEQQYIAQPKL